MSVHTLMLIVVLWTHQLHADDHTEKIIHYVVALFENEQQCFGTLISANWVLTAANCLTPTKTVQYGDLTIPLNESTSKRDVLHKERPRSSTVVEPDLGLIYINSVPMEDYAHLSAVDYKAMTGHSTNYTDFSSQDDNIKEGVISTCNGDDKVSSFAPYLCVAPKCTEMQQLSLPGEAGSPLFFDGKLAGVHVGESSFDPSGGSKRYFLRTYTPISPYLSWVQQVISKSDVTFQSRVHTTTVRAMPLQ